MRGKGREERRGILYFFLYLSLNLQDNQSQQLNLTAILLSICMYNMRLCPISCFCLPLCLVSLFSLFYLASQLQEGPSTWAWSNSRFLPVKRCFSFLLLLIGGTVTLFVSVKRLYKLDRSRCFVEWNLIPQFEIAFRRDVKHLQTGARKMFPEDVTFDLST